MTQRACTKATARTTLLWGFFGTLKPSIFAGAGSTQWSSFKKLAHYIHYYNHERIR
ncbi:IS3 family transposase [Halomonas sp. PA5]|nr:IS3 family transposase [Halomonas sp. PA5]